MASMTSPSNTPPPGRPFVWLGVAATLLGLVLVFVQMAMKQLFTPWYAPALAGLGAVCVLAALSKQFTLWRLIALTFTAGVGGLLAFFLGVLLRLPEYSGPMVKDGKMPAFECVAADGTSFRDSDLADGKNRMLVFYRGKW